jgi:hypothetical protein
MLSAADALRFHASRALRVEPALPIPGRHHQATKLRQQAQRSGGIDSPLGASRLALRDLRGEERERGAA